MRVQRALIASAVITAALSGCGSLGSTAEGAPSGAASSPSAAASQGPCTTKACIAADGEDLKGTVAKDNSVMTKVTCSKSTVRQVVAGTYTVHCTATYSDGTVARGIASVLTGTGAVDWEVTTIITEGSGD
jgi:hypothetical protein